MKDSLQTLLRTLRSLKWAAWYTITIGIESLLQPNPWTHHRTKSLRGTFINRAVEYSLNYITVFFFCPCYPTSGLQGTAPWRFFVPLRLDLDLSEGLSEVGLFIFFTIPAMKLSRVIFQPSFFNDSSLLKKSWLYRGWASRWIHSLILAGWNFTKSLHTRTGRTLWKSMKVYWNVTEETTETNWLSLLVYWGSWWWIVDILDDLAYNLCFLCGANID